MRSLHPVSLLSLLMLTSCGLVSRDPRGEPRPDDALSGSASNEDSTETGEDSTETGADAVAEMPEETADDTTGDHPTDTGGTGPTQDPKQVGSCYFEDAALAEAVQKELLYGDADDVLEVSSLSILDGVRSLHGIECLAELTELAFSRNKLEPVLDLSPLSKVATLRNVYFWGGQYENVEVLATLPLARLQLTYLDWASLEHLEGMESLEWLWISHTPARDLSALSSFTNLRTLTLDDTFGTDLSPLGSLDNLEELTLRYVSVKELPGLGQVDHLRSISLTNTDIASLEGLAGAPQLERLEIQRAVRLKNLTGLEELPSLVRLSIQDSAISDVSALAGSNSLDTVELTSATLEDISPLGSCENLKHVNLRDNEIKDLGSLSGAHIEELDISKNPLGSLEPMGTLNGLVTLRMSHVGATSLDFLSGLQLTSLIANDNEIVDVSPLIGMPLQELDLSANNIATLPADFIGARGGCMGTILTQNPLDGPSKDLLETLCSSTDATFVWDGGSCNKCFDLR